MSASAPALIGEVCGITGVRQMSGEMETMERAGSNGEGERGNEAENES